MLVEVSDTVKPVAVGLDVDVAALDTDRDVDVVIALVDGPTSAPNRVKIAVSVLQHLCCSASLSQQYRASSPYPFDPHCQTCTPAVRKSYALLFVGVSWFS
jgi:hypothetical protein